MNTPIPTITLHTADDKARRDYITAARNWLHDFREDVKPVLRAAHNGGETAARDTWLYIDSEVSAALRRTVEATQRTIKVSESEYMCGIARAAMQEMAKYGKLFDQY